MRGGHYTAYVKVRSSPCQLKHKRDIQEFSGIASETTDAVDAAEGGSWYHVSDSSVSGVTEDRVRSCQAYVLFYEKVN